MVILFVHQNFPGQYLHLAAALRERGGADRGDRRCHGATTAGH